MDTTASTPESAEKARILAEALPYMQRYAGETVVIKYGGHAMGDPELADQFARDVVLLKHAGMNPIVVHGGGPQIQAMLQRLGIESEFSAGLRITNAATAIGEAYSDSVPVLVLSSVNASGDLGMGRGQLHEISDERLDGK